jgi:hypothetical protein
MYFDTTTGMLDIKFNRKEDQNKEKERKKSESLSKEKTRIFIN